MNPVELCYKSTNTAQESNEDVKIFQNQQLLSLPSITAGSLPAVLLFLFLLSPSYPYNDLELMLLSVSGSFILFLNPEDFIMDWEGMITSRSLVYITTRAAQLSF